MAFGIVMFNWVPNAPLGKEGIMPKTDLPNLAVYISVIIVWWAREEKSWVIEGTQVQEIAFLECQ